MVSQGTRTQQKTVFWPLIIHPLCCAGRCWFIVAEDGPLCYLDDSLLVKFTRMSIQIAWETPSWNILHIFNYSSTVLSIHKWLECVKCITKKTIAMTQPLLWGYLLLNIPAGTGIKSFLESFIWDWYWSTPFFFKVSYEVLVGLAVLAL